MLLFWGVGKPVRGRSQHTHKQTPYTQTHIDIIIYIYRGLLRKSMGDYLSYLRNTNLLKISWKILKNDGDNYYLYNLGTMFEFLCRCEIYSANKTGLL